jgi:acyl-CoA thioester hydrolase
LYPSPDNTILTEPSSSSPQLPSTNALDAQPSLNATTEKWFEYVVHVQPHHTDYSGQVWHGTYMAWMEEARVEYFRSLGLNFADLVKMGCDLPVVELSLRYHRAFSLVETAIVKTRMHEIAGVRINWDYLMTSTDKLDPYVSGQVTLVAIDRDKGKILRQLPPAVKEILLKAH